MYEVKRMDNGEQYCRCTSFARAFDICILLSENKKVDFMIVKGDEIYFDTHNGASNR